MKKLTQDLIEEHASILLMLMVMKKVAERLKNGNKIEKDHLYKIIEFLHNFADKCHHGKEEDILFPEIVKESSNIPLVNELLGEHKTGRDFIRGISESAEKYSPGSSDAIHIAINAEGYVSLLAEHIKKEGTLLFPIAEKLLDGRQTEIEERFEILERDVIGVGKHEEYHGWLEELKNIYLT
jgi:hemerythrin-like domain-containing protein